MPSLVAQTVLFLSSFSPLFCVFALLDTFGEGWPSIVCLVVAAASAVGLAVFLHIARDLGTLIVTAARARHRDVDAIGYVATYLIPFAAMPGSEGRAKFAVMIFLAVVGVLYIRAFLFYVNPLLSLAGFRLFEIETETGRTLLVITRRMFIPANAELTVRTLSDYVFIEA